MPKPEPIASSKQARVRKRRVRRALELLKLEVPFMILLSAEGNTGMPMGRVGAAGLGVCVVVVD